MCHLGRDHSITLNFVFLYKIRGLNRSQPVLTINQLQTKQLADIKIPYRELFAPFSAKYTYHSNCLNFKRKQTSKLKSQNTVKQATNILQLANLQLRFHEHDNRI